MGKFRGKSKNKSTFVKVTGLFKSRNKKGLWVGTAKPEYLEGLAEKLESALDSESGLVFALWKNQYDDGPEYNLTVDVAQERERSSRSASTKKRRIEEDDDDAEGEENAEEEEVDL